MRRESYCGLCDDCQLGRPEFLKTVARLREYLDRFRVAWWVHCFPEPESFSFPELKRALDWFLVHTDCPGCKGGRGLALCPIRACAQERGLEHCSQCPDLDRCDLLEPLRREFPDVKTRLRRRRLKFMAQHFHQQLAGKNREG